jgi:hypothetical protein
LRANSLSSTKRAKARRPFAWESQPEGFLLGKEYLYSIHHKNCHLGTISMLTTFSLNLKYLCIWSLNRIKAFIQCLA